jgi:hypothetical protein
VSDPELHHFVPAVYLRCFSNDRGHVWCHDALSEKQYSRKPEQLAKKKDYNTATDQYGGKDRRTIEDFYGDFETVYPRLLSGLNTMSLSFEEQRKLIIFSALQIIRSPMTRKFLTAIADHIPLADCSLLTGLGVSDHEIDLLRRSRTGERQAQDEVSLRLSGHTFNYIIRLLESMNFSVIHLGGESNFITSDNPSMLTGMLKKNGVWRQMSNLKNNRVILLFPVCKNILLFGDNHNSTNNATFGFHFYRIERANRIFDLINEVTFINCSRNVFCNNEEVLVNLSRTFSMERSKIHERQQRISFNLGRLLGSIYSQRKHA